MPRRSSRSEPAPARLMPPSTILAGVALRSGASAAAPWSTCRSRTRRRSRASRPWRWEGHIVDRAHGLAGAEQIAAHREVLGEAGDLQQRLRAPPTSSTGSSSTMSSSSVPMSMALRMPSLSRLKQIDTAKIITPGSAATHGLT